MPDVILVDLMNGSELIKQVRANPWTTKTPIIISSWTAEKHQKIAKELGVHVFLGKSYKKAELLNRWSELIKK